MITLTVDPQDEGVRLDRLLRKHLKLVALTNIYRLIRTGGVKVNGKSSKQDYRCKSGDCLTIAVHPAEAAPNADNPGRGVIDLVKTDFFRRNFSVIFEDEVLLVCNKPTGLVVHGGSGHQSHDTLLDLAESHCIQSAPKGRPPAQPLLVHRLDRDTSGVILLAKDKRLLRFLHESIRSRTFSKEYTALCWGRPPANTGEITAALARDYDYDDGTMVRVSDDGKESHSSYRVVARTKDATRIAVSIHTGRTHQIRVHMAHLACPVIGDIRYGDNARDEQFFRDHTGLKRLCLHASTLSFFYPPLKRVVTFEAPEPPHLIALWKALQQIRT
jgi:23S rRNA pseudouridine955/2504/2580 synthase